jgi:hypothetical protein
VTFIFIPVEVVKTMVHANARCGSVWLEGGRHVYSEKPIAKTQEEVKSLFDIAKAHQVVLASAPCAILSETAQTIWRGIKSWAIGGVKLVNAEIDDGPLHVLTPFIANPLDIPWPEVTVQTPLPSETAGQPKISELRLSRAGFRGGSERLRPEKNELRTGCILDHAAYYLSWVAAIFGPAKRIIPFSSVLPPG